MWRLAKPRYLTQVSFPGAPNSNYTETLNFNKDTKVMDTFRVLGKDGKIIVQNQDLKIDDSTLIKMYKSMIILNRMDLIMYEAQRQGRISFYMTSYGEEATHMGSAAALSVDDVVYGQYRESGVLLYRGFTLDEFMNQMYSNELDYGKGRQMPIHYGKASLNFQTISSPLGTQIPQAAGAAYALKLQKKDAVSICYFGDGAASEGDFHAALNMAATTESPVIFFCRNNGYAISTPVKEQYRGDGIASRGHGYGIETCRVDGNDVLAVYAAVQKARSICLEFKRPCLIEALTYRVGHHSTSDDSSAYRSKNEVSDWQRSDSPINRFRMYLELERKVWNQELEDITVAEAKKDILKAFSTAEKLKKPSLKHMFTDVYDNVPAHLRDQEREVERLLKSYPEHFNAAAHSVARNPF